MEAGDLVRVREDFPLKAQEIGPRRRARVVDLTETDVILRSETGAALRVPGDYVDMILSRKTAVAMLLANSRTDATQDALRALGVSDQEIHQGLQIIPRRRH